MIAVEVITPIHIHLSLNLPLSRKTSLLSCKAEIKNVATRC